MLKSADKWFSLLWQSANQNKLGIFFS